MYYFLESQLNFGKHKKKTIKEILEIEPTYINWCARNIANFIIDNDEVTKIREFLPNFHFSFEENKRIYYWIFADLDNEEVEPEEDYEYYANLLSENADEYYDDYNDFERNDNFKTDWTHYNDDLDWDQQDQEFWEQF